MRWRHTPKPRPYWRDRFAWFPVLVGDYWVWWEVYQVSWAGDYYDRRLPP